MCAKRTMWVLALGVVAAAGTADAQQRVPYYCKDARTAPPECAKYFQTPTGPELWQGPRGDAPRSRTRQETLEEFQDRRLSKGVEQVPGPLRDKAEEELGGAIGKVDRRLRKPLKNIGKAKDLYDFTTDPSGYVRDEAIQKGAEYIWRNAPRTPPSWLAPGVAAGAGAAVTLYPSPTSPRAGVRLPKNADAAQRAYDGLRQGRCVPRDILNLPPPKPEGPSLRAGAPGGMAPRPGPVPGPRPVARPDTSCADFGELNDYVNQYEQDFDASAAKERAQWNIPRELMQDMQEAIAEGERLLKDPSFDPELRPFLQKNLNDLKDMYRQNYDRGVRPPSISQPTPFKNDPVHRAGQEIDERLSIKPWH